MTPDTITPNMNKNAGEEQPRLEGGGDGRRGRRDEPRSVKRLDAVKLCWSVLCRVSAGADR